MGSSWRDTLTAPQFHPNVSPATEGGSLPPPWYLDLMGLGTPDRHDVYSCCGTATNDSFELFAPSTIDEEPQAFSAGPPDETTPGYLPFVVTSLLWVPDGSVIPDLDFAALCATTDGTDDTDPPDPSYESSYGPASSLNFYEAMGNPLSAADEQGAPVATLLPTVIYHDGDWDDDGAGNPYTPWANIL